MLAAIFVFADGVWGAVAGFIDQVTCCMPNFW